MMESELKALDEIPSAVRDALSGFAEGLGDLAGENFRGLTFYGAIASGQFEQPRDRVLSVVVLKEIDLSMLRELAHDGKRLGRQNIAAPIVMTPGYIEDSLDTFPLELIEIHERHITVLGEDYFAELNLEDRHVRLACERELKTLLIAMRQGLLSAGGRDQSLGSLEEMVGEGLIRAMRGLLWLHGQRDASGASDVVGRVEAALDISLHGVREVLDASTEHGWPQFVALYKDLELLRDRADAW
jgi:hypothetical protein